VHQRRRAVAAGVLHEIAKDAASRAGRPRARLRGRGRECGLGQERGAAVVQNFTRSQGAGFIRSPPQDSMVHAAIKL